MFNKYLLLCVLILFWLMGVCTILAESRTSAVPFFAGKIPFHHFRVQSWPGQDLTTVTLINFSLFFYFV